MSQDIEKGSNPKIQLIIDSALAIIRDHGDQGLSMRKVAAKAGMSLGNLQYYFKNKDELLRGMVDMYFHRCSADFGDRLHAHAEYGCAEMVRELVGFGMGYADSEVGKVFRELWSIASRNSGVREHLEEYYRGSNAVLVETLSSFAANKECARQAVALIVPLFEGYGVVASALPVGEEDAAGYYADIVVAVLEGRFAGER